MNSLKKLFSILKSAQKLFLASQIFSFLTLLFNILLLATSAWLISTAALHPGLSALTLAIVGVRFYGIARACMRYAERYFSHNMAFNGLYDLRLWLYEKIEPLAPNILHKYGSGDLLNRLMADIETLQFFFLRVVIPPLSAVVITIIFAWYLGSFSLVLTFILFMAGILAGIALPLLALNRKDQASKKVLSERAEVKNTLVETANGLMDIVVYNKKDLVEKRIWQKFEVEDQARSFLGHSNNVSKTSFVALVQVTIVVIMIAMIKFGMPLDSNGVYLAVVVIGTQAFFECMLPMNDVYYYCRESINAMQRIIDLDKGTLQEGQKLLTTLNEQELIKFNNMSFSYGDKKIFDNFNFTIKCGEKIAIVGASGAGKSTLFNILERFNEYEGSIIFNGIELNEIDQENLRSHIGMIEQNPYIFNATLAENILLANPHEGEDNLNDVIKSAQLEKLAEDNGLNNLIGTMHKLSGGERQRVAIARLLLANKPIWLLDEPLESLDLETKDKIMDVFWDKMKDKTVLYITHQLRGLEKMDRVLFLHMGKIIEQGSYDELMAEKGLFYNYVNLSLKKV